MSACKTYDDAVIITSVRQYSGSGVIVIPRVQVHTHVTTSTTRFTITIEEKT